jgi:hypothetical protein
MGRREKRKRTGARSGSMDVYVVCDQCGEVIKTHIFLSNELYPTYADEGPAYTLRKELIGSKCPNRVQLYMEFDGMKRMISKDITGGSFSDMKEL